VSDQYGRPDTAPHKDDPLLLAARMNDADIEELREAEDPRAAFEAYCQRHGLVLSTVEYLAEQRAIRYALIRTGDEDVLKEMNKTNTATPFAPSPMQREIMQFVQPVYMDAIVIGWRARKLAD
jgi:hypothetical protein